MNDCLRGPRQYKLHPSWTRSIFANDQGLNSRPFVTKTSDKQRGKIKLWLYKKSTLEETIEIIYNPNNSFRSQRCPWSTYPASSENALYLLLSSGVLDVDDEDDGGHCGGDTGQQRWQPHARAEAQWALSSHLNATQALYSCWRGEIKNGTQLKEKWKAKKIKGAERQGKERRLLQFLAKSISPAHAWVNKKVPLKIIFWIDAC